MAGKLKNQSRRTHGKNSNKPEKEQGKRTYGRKPAKPKRGGSLY